MSEDETPVTIGQDVYDENGQQIGTIRGFDQDGFFVTTREGIAGLSLEHERSGQEFGEAYLMWRCSQCGEMGDLEGSFPEECPSCGSPREDIYYWTED